MAPSPSPTQALSDLASEIVAGPAAQASIAQPVPRRERRLRLPEQITVNHGPAQLLGRFFLKADADARERGVTLFLHQDLDTLVDANRRLQAQWAPLVPIFDPDRSAARPDAGFWIEGRNDAGETVATQAARFFPWFDTNLEQELSSLRLFYADPARQAQPGERAEVLAPSAARISGRVVFSGGGWYRRDFRGIGLSAILPRISRAYAYTRFRSEVTFSLVEPVLVEKGVTRRYGYRRSEPVVRFTGSFRGDLDFHLVWMSSEELVDELHDHMTSSTTSLERSSEVAATSTLPRQVHGSSSLS